MGQTLCPTISGEHAPEEIVEFGAKLRDSHWVPLESNPEVLNDFAWKAGLPRSWEFVDVFGIEADLLAMVPAGCVALTLLFHTSPALQRYKEEQSRSIEAKGQRLSPDLVYVKQYIGNACGTIACIHCMANNAKVLGLPEETPMGRYLSRIRGKSPEQAGAMLGDATDLHQASEVCATGGQTPTPEATSSVDAHFVAFVEKDGEVYELDGCKAAPVNHGSSDGDLLWAATAIVKAKYMNVDPENILFNMMALVPAA